MTDPSLSPLPPSDLARRPLPLTTLPVAMRVFRIHRSARAPLYFGPHPGGLQGRFDDPQREFGVCYVGVSREAAFAETFLRRVPVRILSRAFLDERSLSAFMLTRELHMVALHGASLAPMGATAVVGTGPHDAARQWSRALWSHPECPDGIQYRARHDDDEFSLAIFDRAVTALRVEETLTVRADSAWFAEVMNRYSLSLDD